MVPSLIELFIKEAVTRRGAKAHQLEYYDLVLPSQTIATINAHGSDLILVESPTNVKIDSQLAKYGFGETNGHIFSGDIEVQNKSSMQLSVAFVKIMYTY